ncbi:MAG TPA: glycosyl hydrolase family 18 protein [Bacilli bacterium]|nr:glycosyl hydrolase family 18 protein [Bacilli bacterium]
MEGSRVTFVVVQQGETIDNLAERYDITVDELTRLNEGVRDVDVGDVLKVIERKPTFDKPRVRTHYVQGFYTGPMGVNMPGSQSAFERHANLLTSLAPYWFDLDLRTPGKIKARATPTAIRSLVGDAHRRGVKILASIHNTDKPPSGVSRTEVLHSVLRAHRMAFINNIIGLVDEYGFDGVNLDFERLRDGDKALYTAFVCELAQRLDAKGKTLNIDVLADVRKEPYSLDFDFPGLAKCADHLAMMTYDQYKASEPYPGPVAALPWVEDTLKQALNEGVPPEKILLGIPVYGYDWTVGQGNARALSYDAVNRVRRQFNGVTKFHPTFKVPHMTYTDSQGRQHEVWYEDARSLALKLDLVRKYNLAGVIIWRLGLEDPAAWGVIRAKLSPIA